MANANRATCPRCGAPILSDGPAGPCPRCLVSDTKDGKTEILPVNPSSTGMPNARLTPISAIAAIGTMLLGACGSGVGGHSSQPTLRPFSSVASTCTTNGSWRTHRRVPRGDSDQARRGSELARLIERALADTDSQANPGDHGRCRSRMNPIRTLANFYGSIVYAIGPERWIPRLTQRVLCWVRTKEKKVALTFDDGPNPEYTPLLLTKLAEYRVSATFFLIGRNLKDTRISAVASSRKDTRSAITHITIESCPCYPRLVSGMSWRPPTS